MRTSYFIQKCFVVAYHTLRSGEEGVVGVAPMVNFHMSFLFNKLF